MEIVMSGSVFNGKSIMQLVCLDFTSYRLKKKKIYLFDCAYVCLPT